MRWWQRLLNRRTLETDLDRELRFHFDRQVEDNIRAGMSDEEARRRARLQFGGLDQIKEQCRDARGTRWVDDLGSDLRFALRLLAKERGVTAVAVLALALGIGVSNTFFIVVNAVCLRGLPIDEVERVMFVSQRDARENELGVSYGEFEHFRAGAQAFAGLAAFTSGPVVLADEGRAPDRVTGAYVSAGTFSQLGEAPIAGRDFVRDEDRPGAAPVVMLSAGVWKRRYQSDRGIVGRTIRVNGQTATVIGVMREGFRFPNNADIWQPLAQMPGLVEQPHDARSLAVFGRLRDGVDTLQAAAELTAVAADLSRRFPETNRGVRPTIVPINVRYNGRITDPVWLAFITAGLLVLLIACANVANLLLMRAVHRGREIAVRVSLGATRLRVVRQLLAESAMLAALGGLLGLGLSVVGARLLSVALTENAPYWLQFTLDFRGLAALMGVCILSVLVFGLVPALHLSRTDFNDLLQEGGRSGPGGMRSRRWTAVFLTSEFALTMVLLAAVAVGLRNSQESRAGDLVIDTAGVLTMWVSLPTERYKTPLEQVAFYDRLNERLRVIEAISSSAFASALPLGGAGRASLTIDGTKPTDENPPTVSTLTIGGDYFATLGVSMLRGRTFNESDGAAGEGHAIVNERFLSLFLAHEDPIGRRIQLRDPRTTETPAAFTIVGVSRSVRQRSRGIEADPVVYLPLRRQPLTTTAVLLRHSGEPDSIASLIRHELRALDPELPLYRVMTLDRVISESTINGRVSQALITVIALIALGLSIVGLHAVTGHAVAQRTREIGIRVALGARPRQLVTMVLSRAARQLAYGLIAGAGCTALWEWLLGDATQKYRMTDPWILSATSAVVITVALVACILPARTASALDPVAALRHE